MRAARAGCRGCDQGASAAKLEIYDDTAWVAIVAVPTMIAGIYGMNFRNMPELTWTYGYPAAIGLMLAICISLCAFFRRSGWL